MLKRVIGVVGMLAHGSSCSVGRGGRQLEMGMRLICMKNQGFFSKSKRLTPEEIPLQSRQIRYSSTLLGEQQVDYFRTEGSVSIVERGLGNTTESSQLYALKLKCSACKTQSIRSFSKQAYHNGLVMVRCGNCQKLHLVADKLGWFNENVADSTTPQGGERIAHDPVAIVRFLKEILKQEKMQQKTQKQDSQPSQKSE